MVLVFVTVSALALPYAQEDPRADADEVAAIDETVPLVLLDEGDETIDGRHHYISNNRRPAAYYNRPSYNRPAMNYNYRPSAGAYNSRPHNYGSAGHHTSGGYGGYAGHQSNNYHGNSYYGYQHSNHGTFGGLGWREAQKSSGDDVAAAPPVEEEELLVQDVEETPAAPGVVVFQQ
jgi:hypothetical protein